MKGRRARVGLAKCMCAALRWSANLANDRELKARRAKRRDSRLKLALKFCTCANHGTAGTWSFSETLRMCFVAGDEHAHKARRTPEIALPAALHRTTPWRQSLRQSTVIRSPQVPLAPAL